MKKKSKWLIITSGSEKKMLLFEDIIRIDYYGEAKYILKENFFLDIWRKARKNVWKNSVCHVK